MLEIENNCLVGEQKHCGNIVRFVLEHVSTIWSSKWNRINIFRFGPRILLCDYYFLECGCHLIIFHLAQFNLSDIVNFNTCTQIRCILQIKVPVLTNIRCVRRHLWFGVHNKPSIVKCPIDWFFDKLNDLHRIILRCLQSFLIDFLLFKADRRWL